MQLWSVPPLQVARAVLGCGRQVYWGRAHKPQDIGGQRHKFQGAPQW